MSVLVLCLLIAGLLVIRVPVAFAFFGPCLLYMITTDQSLGLALRLVASSTASFPLLAVPLFILLGCIANHAGIADRLFDFALALLGRVRGSLGYVSVGVSLGFSWMSGSAVADAAALGKVEIPAMLRAGYSKPFALGVVGSSSLIAPVMPPSIPAVIYAGPRRGLDRRALRGVGGAGAADGARPVRRRVPLGAPDAEHRAHRVQLGPGVGHRAPGDRAAGCAGHHPGRHPRRLRHADRGGGRRRGVHGASSGSPTARCTLRDLPKILVEATVTTGAIMLIVASANLLGYVFARERIPQEHLRVDARADQRRRRSSCCSCSRCRWSSARRSTRSPCSP